VRRTFAQKAAAVGLVFGMTGPAMAQNTAPAPLQVPNPHYESIQLEIAVNKSAVEAWKTVGKFCPEWAANCTITSGKDGELGAVRTLGGGEVLVARTALSYTYTMPVRAGVPYNLYHGTVEARAVTPTTSKIVYMLVFDNSMLPDDAARRADIDRRTMMFTGVLQNIKALVETGKLPPAAAPLGGAR
jgi:hypothetical protein